MSFSSKVSNIVKDFDGHLASPVENSASTVFDSFHLLDSSEVAKLRKIKCSPLDFFPTPVFAKLWPYLTPLVTNIVNLSPSDEVFLAALKCSHVTATKSPIAGF